MRLNFWSVLPKGPSPDQLRDNFARHFGQNIDRFDSWRCNPGEQADTFAKAKAEDKPVLEAMRDDARPLYKALTPYWVRLGFWGKIGYRLGLVS